MSNVLRVCDVVVASWSRLWNTTLGQGRTQGGGRGGRDTSLLGELLLREPHDPQPNLDEHCCATPCAATHPFQKFTATATASFLNPGYVPALAHNHNE